MMGIRHKILDSGSFWGLCHVKRLDRHIGAAPYNVRLGRAYQIVYSELDLPSAFTTCDNSHAK